MTDPQRHDPHAIDYVEIAALDVAAAKRFYAKAFGWTFTDYGPEYAGIRGPEREVGGLCRSDRITPGGPLVVLYSDDLDATLAAVRDAGGRIVKEPFEFPGGRRFHFADQLRTHEAARCELASGARPRAAAVNAALTPWAQDRA